MEYTLERTNQLNLIENYYNTPKEESIDDTDFGYNLYPEQKQVLYLMKELESKKDIIVSGSDKYHKVCYNKLCLAAPFSFGKTVVSLALIKLKTTPIDRNWYSFFNNESYKETKNEILELHVKRPFYVDTTLVIVSPSTFHQWLKHIEKVNINCLVINNIDDLDKLLVNVINNTLYRYDLVLLVYRKLRPGYYLPYGKSVLNWSESTNITVLSILSTDKVWKRVIIDDFDSININNDMLIPARIIWLISTTATTRFHRNSYNMSRHTYHTSKCYDISALNHRIMDVIKDPILSNLAIRSNLNVNIPKIIFHSYIFKYGRTVNQILNNLSYPPDVSERINSGDISGAAASLEMSRNCSSLGEFLYLLIHKNKQSYEHFIKLCDQLERVISIIDDNFHTLVRDDIRTEEEMVMNEHKSPLDFIKDIKDQKEWTQYINKLNRHEEFITSTEFADIKKYLNECKDNAGNFKNILERIKRNMEDGTCGKCFCEPEDDKFILQCCNVLLCKYCMLRNDTNIFIDRCPNCSVKLDKHSFIRMPKDISLEEFINTDYQDAFSKLRNYCPKCEGEEVDDEIGLLPKQKALLSIIRGNKNIQYMNYKKNIGLDMSNVIESDNVLEKPEDIPNKFVVFTKYSDITSNISHMLNKYNIKNTVLRGTNSKNIKRELNKFQHTDTNVMLIPSQDICAGLDLEFATHLIFYHTVRVAEVTAQIVGRAQRIGRKHSLNLIALQNENEYSPFYFLEV